MFIHIVRGFNPRSKGILQHLASITIQVQNIIYGLLVELDVGIRKVLLSRVCLSNICEYLVIDIDIG